MPKKLILDVDTGTDDAIALMLAALHPDLELVAATTVNGNNPVANCTDNTLRVFDLLGLDIPVHEGMATPMVRDDFPVPREILHAKGSMHGRELPIPKPHSVKRSQRAVEFLVETYMATTDEIALVPVGPLTNIAMALKLEPRIVERIPRTILMGGGHAVSNTTPSAEFNIWVDPEAARVVFRAGLRDLVVVPLDATHRALVTSDDCRRLRERARRRPTRRRRSSRAGSPPTTPSSRWTSLTARRSTTRCASPISWTPRSSAGRRVHVDVETDGGLTVGRTVMDVGDVSGRSPTPSSPSKPTRRGSCRSSSRLSAADGLERQRPPSVRPRRRPRAPGRGASS